MGGLCDKIPLTFWTFLIGMLALSGCPASSPASSARITSFPSPTRMVPFFYWVGVITAFLTAFYMTRLVVVAFFGPARTPPPSIRMNRRGHDHPARHPRRPLRRAGWPFLGIKELYHDWSSRRRSVHRFGRPFQLRRAERLHRNDRPRRGRRARHRLGLRPLLELARPIRSISASSPTNSTSTNSTTAGSSADSNSPPVSSTGSIAGFSTASSFAAPPTSASAWANSFASSRPAACRAMPFSSPSAASS